MVLAITVALIVIAGLCLYRSVACSRYRCPCRTCSPTNFLPPATSRDIRRGEKRNRADLRRALGR